MKTFGRCLHFQINLHFHFGSPLIRGKLCLYLTTVLRWPDVTDGMVKFKNQQTNLYLKMKLY